MIKAEQYQSLVQKRKACTLCQGLCNPSTACGGRHDSSQIGPWTLWQGNLDAQVVVVGQDWGDMRYYTKWEGRDQGEGNPTNENLRKLLGIIGLKVEGPRDTQAQVAFFTNLVLCLKTGGLQGPVDDSWFSNCSRTFFKPLMDIIRPRAILALGRKTSEAILDLYGVNYPSGMPYSTLLEGSPYRLTDKTVLFPLYHCGAGSINRNRSMEEQVRDWAEIAKWLSSGVKTVRM